jgi:hypothetical protein
MERKEMKELIRRCGLVYRGELRANISWMQKAEREKMIAIIKKNKKEILDNIDDIRSELYREEKNIENEEKEKREAEEKIEYAPLMKFLDGKYPIRKNINADENKYNEMVNKINNFKNKYQNEGEDEGLFHAGEHEKSKLIMELKECCNHKYTIKYEKDRMGSSDNYAKVLIRKIHCEKCGDNATHDVSDFDLKK